MDKTLYSRDDIDFMFQEKKWAEDTPELKIVWMHQYAGTRTTVKTTIIAIIYKIKNVRTIRKTTKNKKLKSEEK